MTPFGSSPAQINRPAPGLTGCPSPVLPADTGVRRVDALADLCAIFEPQVQVCVYRRQVSTDLAAGLRGLGSECGSGLRACVPVGRDGAQGLSTLALPPVPDRSALLDELAFLIEIYGDLLGCRTVGLRVECLDRAMCPLWHVDRTGIRLLCTWVGPGTEWLDGPLPERGARADGAAQPEPSGRAEPFDIVLLKGSAWQGNAGRGAVHRSPAVPIESGPRVLVSLDALWGDDPPLPLPA